MQLEDIITRENSIMEWNGIESIICRYNWYQVACNRWWCDVSLQRGTENYWFKFINHTPYIDYHLIVCRWVASNLFWLSMCMLCVCWELIKARINNYQIIESVRGIIKGKITWQIYSRYYTIFTRHLIL